MWGGVPGANRASICRPLATGAPGAGIGARRPQRHMASRYQNGVRLRLDKARNQGGSRLWSDRTENQSSVEKTTLEGMASEMQLLEDGVSFADKELRRGDNPERLERTGKFVDRKVRQPRICQNRRTSL